MTYPVYWASIAESQLARIWLGSRHRGRVTDAANAVDTQLSQDPTSVGESRSDDYRIVFEWPLIVTFRVDHPNQAVFVVAVWEY
ncbi:MAG: hypothetical protein ACRCT8_07340 [Lacipirellulaceae bacterium]